MFGQRRKIFIERRVTERFVQICTQRKQLRMFFLIRFALPVFFLFSICFFSFILTLFFHALYNNLCTKTTLNVVILVSHSQETGDKKTACIVVLQCTLSNQSHCRFFTYHIIIPIKFIVLRIKYNKSGKRKTFSVLVTVYYTHFAYSKQCKSIKKLQSASTGPGLSPRDYAVCRFALNNKKCKLFQVNDIKTLYDFLYLP